MSVQNAFVCYGRRVRSCVVDLLCGVIDVYRRTVSHVLPRACRFSPSCSEYAQAALRRHGIVYGSLLTLWRLLRCQPLCRGGYDPVP